MPASVAIVGSGPSGCYRAQALLKAQPDLKVDLIDRLPVPYGLVRYGVATDDQGTKAVIRQFERLFERQGAGFIGNLAVGEDVSLEALRDAYDAVVLAAGLSADRRLGIPGEDLAGVAAAGDVTRALNDHPDAPPLPPLGRRVVVMGNGNVAIDLIRLLAKSADELAGTDLGPRPTAWLTSAGVESIDIVGRSPAASAKFDPVMVKELHRLAHATIRVEGAGTADDPEGQKKLDALAAIDGVAHGPRRLTFRFGLTPLALEGEDGHVAAARFRDADGAEVTLPCDTFLSAIGFDNCSNLSRAELIAAATDIEAGVLALSLYATGCFRRGPRGTIPDNRADRARGRHPRAGRRLRPDRRRREPDPERGPRARPPRPRRGAAPDCRPPGLPDQPHLGHRRGDLALADGRRRRGALRRAAAHHHRGDLLRAMEERVPAAAIRLGHTVTGVVPEDAGSVRTTFDPPAPAHHSASGRSVNAGFRKLNR